MIDAFDASIDCLSKGFFSANDDDTKFANDDDTNITLRG